ncbi:integral membrane protein [Streptomyces clavuligerus]|nr:integral membrane protein [Streptomyces clavuligerus]
MPTDTGPGATAPAPSGPKAPRGRSRAARWCAGLLLLVVTAVVGCRAAGTDGVTPVPQLLAFLPWLLLPAGAALLLALLARWRFGLVWAVLVLAVVEWFVRPYDTGLADRPSGPVIARLSVLTSNVEYGNAAPALVATVRREQPDLVFVQECPITCSRALAEEIPRAEYPYRHVVEGYGADGAAILSKHPLRKTAGVPGSLAMPGAVAEIAGREVRLQLVHPLPPIPGMVDDWHRELGHIRAYAAGVKDAPAIVAGDFNATQDHAGFRRVLDAGGLRDSAALGGASRTPSWPTAVFRPLGAQIDHVLIGRDLSVRGARFLELPDTDHRALLVGLELHASR